MDETKNAIDRELKEFLLNSSLDQLSSSELSHKRVRFLQKSFSNLEGINHLWSEIYQLKITLKNQTTLFPYADQFFLRPTDSGVDLLIPVTGQKNVQLKDFQILDLTFPKLGTLILPHFLAERAQISSFLMLCRELDEENKGVFLKKILVELNSKDLALHFFL